MERKQINMMPEDFPAEFQPLLKHDIYDSSCSPQARVYFIDKESGYYLKRSPKGTLATEAEMTRYFHSKGFAAEVFSYQELEEDWLLTARVPGEDGTYGLHLSEPERLCDLYAETLRKLHDTDGTDCSVQDRMSTYLQTAEQNYRAGMFDPGYLMDASFPDAESTWRFAMKHAHLLKANTLIHGDYCLPNIMINQWRFSKFIDLGNSGIGDRHIDLYWGIWSLQYNLKTNRYRDRFLDAYGRDRVNEELLKVVGAFECFG